MRLIIDNIKGYLIPLFSLIAIFSIILVGNNDIIYSVIIDKQMGLSVFLIILSLVSIIAIKNNSSKVIKITYTDLCIALLYLYFVVNYFFFSNDISSDWYSMAMLVILYVNFRILISIYRSIGFYIIIILCVILIIELFIGGLQCIGILKSFHPLFKLTGTFFNPGPFSNFIAILFPMYVYYLILLIKLMRYRQNNIFLLKCLFFLISISIIGSIIILPLTMGRSAWIGVALSLCILVFRETKLKIKIKYFFKNKRFLSYFTVLLAIIILSIVGLLLYDLKSESAKGRILIWQLSSKVFMKNPITGVGFGNFKGNYADIQSYYFDNSPNSDMVCVAGSPDFAFNDYLQILAEGGIIGIIIFALICTLVLRLLILHKQGIIYAVISLLFISLTSYPLNVLPIGMIVVFFSAYSQKFERKYINSVKYHCIIVILVIGSIMTTYSLDFLTKKRRALDEWTIHQPSYRNNSFKSVVHVYDKIYPYLLDEATFLIEYAICLAHTKRYDESIKILIKYKNRFNDPLYYSTLAKSYEGVNQKEIAEFYFKKAITHSPNRIEALFYFAEFYNTEQRYAMSDSIINIALNKKLKINNNAKKVWHEKLINLRNKTSKLNNYELH